MNYARAVTIPAETSATDPLESVIPLAPGTLESVALTFPSGCLGLVGVRLVSHGFPIFPLSAGEWIVSDDKMIVQTVHRPLRDRPFSVSLVGYNEDTKWPHTIYVGVEVSLPDTLDAGVLALLEERLPVGLDQLIAGQTEIREGQDTSVTILRDEFLPILKALLDVQYLQAKRDLGGLSLDELLTLPPME